MRELADREATLRRDAQALADEHAQAQVALARLEDRATALGAELEAIAARLERAAFAPPTDDGEAERLREQVHRLVRRRERIGPVNPLAEAECAELSERASFVREQRRDLEQSSTRAPGAHQGADGAASTRTSAETFAAVQTQFEHMIGVLFPEGHGRLLLVDGEADGEPGGVAVEVKPARKFGKKLQLLSGGERSLVAIAFLMALVLSRPCPFYILDEIEAALDDINIGRFVGLVREYHERTQFVIITHQKRTMEAADMLYGVTLGPDGASRVVSARMAEEEIDRRAAAAQTSAGSPARPRGKWRRIMEWHEVFKGLREAVPAEVIAEEERERAGMMRRFRAQPRQGARGVARPFQEHSLRHGRHGDVGADRGGADLRRRGCRCDRRRSWRSSSGASTRRRSRRAEPLLEELAEVVRGHAAPAGASAAEALAAQQIDVSEQPTVVLVVGVNGTGKTTTIGKIAYRLKQLGKMPLVVAGDTFRAAAVEQLAEWAAARGCDIIKQKPGSDPAAVVYDGLAAARSRGADVVLIDTAGRLHTQVNLMRELAKVRRVIEKQLPGAPHETLLVLDATTGQNGLPPGARVSRGGRA